MPRAHSDAEDADRWDMRNTPTEGQKGLTTASRRAKQRGITLIAACNHE